MGPVICMITAASDDGRAELDRVRAAARAGVHLVQIRQPAWDARDLSHLVETAVAAVRGTATRVLVNDRLDVALAAGAAGVHLRSDSVPASRVRTMTPHGFVIGRSVHSEEEAVRVTSAGGLDYLLFGTVFPTSSKPGVEPAGIEALAVVCAAVPVPVLAVGGVTADERLARIAAAGAAGFAAIGLFADCPVDALPAVMGTAARAFETRVPAS